MILNNILKTERLILRCKNFDDIYHLFRLRSDQEYFELFGRECYTRIEQAHEFIEMLNKDNTSYTFSILPKDKTVSEEAIGSVCIWDIKSDEKVGELGYSLESAYRGNGYALEACKEVIDFTFSEMGINTIVAYPKVTNHPSIILVEKLGFECVGIKTLKMESGEETEHYVFYLSQ